MSLGNTELQGEDESQEDLVVSPDEWWRGQYEVKPGANPFKPLSGEMGRTVGGGMPCLLPTIISVVTVGVLTLVQLLG